MARKRMLDPHIWEDPGFNKLSLQARLLFVGMISNADDEGYFRADAGSLKRLIFGFDDNISKEQVTEWLNELNQIPTIHFFKVNNEIFGHFIKWNEYQKQREDRIQPSVYPKCDKCQTSVRQVTAEVKLSKDKLSKDNILNNDEKNSEEFSDLEQLRENKTNSSINYEFQSQAIQIIEALKIPQERKSAYFKVCKEEPRGVILEAYSFAQDHPKPDARDKMFFFRLNQLKENYATA